MYLNLVLGNQNGFRNLTTQIQNLTSDVGLYRDEIISKIEVSLICTVIFYKPWSKVQVLALKILRVNLKREVNF